MLTVSVALALFLLQSAFAAGLWYASTKQLRRDVNGIGKKVRDLGLAVQISAPADRKDEITLILAGSSREARR